MFAADEGFKKEVAAALETSYGLYEELDWETVIRPLPDDWDLDDEDNENGEDGAEGCEEGAENRPAKRQRIDDGWLIQLGLLLGAY